MSKFIYVFRAGDADKLISLGYTLVKEDYRNAVWVFENKNPESLEFDLAFPYVLSNVIHL